MWHGLWTSMNPFITAACVTFGRVKFLEQAIACFLNQKYDGKSQLLILNTCPQQTLYGDFQNVKIINLKERPISLGAARNIAVEHADGTHIVTYDDDDIFGENHLRNFAAGFEGGHNWVHLDKQFFCEQFKISKIVGGQMPCFAFTKKAWEKVGKYSDKFTVGEDRNFVGRLTSQLSGRVFNLVDNEISFFYSWGNGSHHVSGMGEDKKGFQTAHDRIAEDLRRRIRVGSEKTGDIILKPFLEHDPKKMMQDFMDAYNQKKNHKWPVCIVELGRFGDIVNILPICKHIAENYAKPHLMVSREFASVLEGVSYVIPEIVDIDYSRVLTAMDIARPKFPIVLQAQIYGKNYTPEKTCASYNVQSWKMLGFEHRFKDPSLDLVFDRRDAHREAQLVTKLSTDKPMLLVQVTSGVSSPFSGGVALLEEIKKAFGESLNVVDLDKVRAEKIYDIIGLMDNAIGLVSIDTALLHLAAASSVPVVALVNPQPWAGSMLRCNCFERITYAEATKQRVFEGIGKIIAADKWHKSLGDGAANPIGKTPIKPAPSVRLFHITERHEETNIDTANRKRACNDSWDAIYATGKVLPVHMWKYPRDAREIGEPRALPYLKDLLKMAMEQADDNDLIFFTNDDNILHLDLPEMIRFYGSVYDACSSQRVEIKHAVATRALNPVEMAKNAQPHFGRDLFVFKKSWLVKHWDELGEPILAAANWDVMMTALIRLYHGIKSDRASFLKHIFPAECPKGYIFHISHESAWAKSGYVHTSPANLHNGKIFKDWAAKNLPDLHFTENNCI